MGTQYHCPKCSAVLNPGKNIILLGRFDEQEALFAFHPEPGNYEFSIPEGMSLKEGDLWDFMCPVCHTQLSLVDKDHFASLDMMDGLGNWHKVVFSCIAGEKVTYVLTQNSERSVEEYGPDLSNYKRKEWSNFI